MANNHELIVSGDDGTELGFAVFKEPEGFSDADLRSWRHTAPIVFDPSQAAYENIVLALRPASDSRTLSEYDAELEAGTAVMNDMPSLGNSNRVLIREKTAYIPADDFSIKRFKQACD